MHIVQCSNITKFLIKNPVSNRQIVMLNFENLRRFVNFNDHQRFLYLLSKNKRELEFIYFILFTVCSKSRRRGIECFMVIFFWSGYQLRLPLWIDITLLICFQNPLTSSSSPLGILHYYVQALCLKFQLLKSYYC